MSVYSQYAPAAGIPGSSAIHADSSVFVNWGSNAQFERGWMNIADKSLGKVSSGLESDVYGKADNACYSLGDSGYVTFQFIKPIINGPSWDFAIFENSFDDYFLELARIQISSNGNDFYEFPSHSLTQTTTQKGAFDTLSPQRINNLAGKYKGQYGTPFDLEELKDVSGLDINNITHIRIIDVVGSIDSNLASIDTAGNFINDPYPTPFASGGFDLDAIGIIHQFVGFDNGKNIGFSFYPNPVKDFLNIVCKQSFRIEVLSIDGSLIYSRDMQEGRSIVDVSGFEVGVYFIRFIGLKNESNLTRKFVKI